MSDFKGISSEFKSTPISREISKRGEQWELFSFLTLIHIEKYTIKQYGDMPNDQVTDFSVEDFKTTLKRYANRIGSNARGLTEARRDCLKIAHYACVLHYKLGKEEREKENEL
jgi:hypothetical protein